MPESSRLSHTPMDEYFSLREYQLRLGNINDAPVPARFAAARLVGTYGSEDGLKARITILQSESWVLAMRSAEYKQHMLAIDLAIKMAVEVYEIDYADIKDLLREANITGATNRSGERW